MLVRKATDKLLEENEKLRTDHRDGIADMTKRVDGIEIRMGSETASMSQPSLGSPSESEHTLGSMNGDAHHNPNGKMDLERIQKYQENREKFARDMNNDLHQQTSINGDVHGKRVESVTIIKGGHGRKERHFFWTQSDRRMCWGLLPINVFGWKKYYLELVTLIFVMFSVLLIIVQSFPEYDPHCIPEHIPVDDSNITIATNATKRIYICNTNNHNKEAKAYHTIFYIQFALVVWFTMEYIVRFMAVRPNWKVHRPYTGMEFWSAKLTHVCSFMTMIDLLSISPFYIERLLEASGGSAGGAGTILTVLRVIRILRVFKMTKSNQTLTDLFAAFRIIAEDMLIIVVLLITVMTLLSTAVYYCERDVEHFERFEGEIWFNSILDSYYWTSVTITSVGYGDVVPRTRGGRVVAGITSILSVLVINLPIAIIIISFDEVYRIRRGREIRASLVTERLFKWVDRAKIATEKAKHPRKHDVQIRKADRERRQKAAEDGKSDDGPTLTLRVAGLEGTDQDGSKGLTMKQLTRRSRQIERAKQRKRRSDAKRFMTRLILNPGTSTREMSNNVYNGQEHYLASKYFTAWEDRTRKGRADRDKEALDAIRGLVNATDGTLHQHHKDSAIKWMNVAKMNQAATVLKAGKKRKTKSMTLKDMRIKSTNIRRRASSFGKTHGLVGGRPSVGLAFGKIHIEKGVSDLSDDLDSDDELF